MNVSITKRATAVGKQVDVVKTVTSDGAVLVDPTLAAAKTGTLTTRTNSTTGTLTMSASHGITTGARLDLYWSGGSRYGITAGTVSVNSVPISGGTGDDLPAQDAAVTAMVPQKEAFAAPYAALQSLLVGCSRPATAVFLDAGDAEVFAAVVEENDGYIWEVNDGSDNPFDATDVASVYLSHGYSSGSAQVSAVAGLN